MIRPLLAAVCLSFPAAAYAGDLVPTDSRYGPLRIASHKVDVSIDNQIALVRVEQVFANDHAAQLEAHYVFPVPKAGTIIDFSMTVNGKLVRGELLEKDRARQIYEGVLRRSKDPGLLEHVGANVFRVRVFPILPNSEQKVELTYVERVNYDGGACRYVYPLRVPGSKGGTRTDRFEFRWRLASLVPLREISSPTHPVNVARRDEHVGEVVYDGKQVDLSKDLEITYWLARPANGMDLAAHRPADGDGTFLLLITPEANPRRIPKDVTFVFDTSGSMEGHRIRQARAALKFCLSKLAPDDRFNIVAFSSEINVFLHEPTVATEKAKEMAAKFVDSLDASGGTNICDALLRALRHKAEASRPHQILFLTDGEPTVGVTDPKSIVRTVLAANDANVRIFAFGVGDSLNKALLEELAEATRAVAEFVAESEDIEEKVSRLQKKVASPVISNLSIDWGDSQVSALYPKSPGDLFAGTQLMLTGRYSKAGTFEVTLKGQAGSQPVEVRQKLVFPETSGGAPAVPYFWAMRKIAALLDEIRRSDETDETVKQLVAISKQYRIATPYTSFLVLESEAAYDQHGIERKGPKYQPPRTTGAAPASPTRPSGANLFATDAWRGAGKVFVPGLNDNWPKFDIGLYWFLRAGKAHRDGSFGPETVKAGGRTFSRAGTTGLVLLGLVNSNYWEDPNYFGPVAQDALSYLRSRQTPGGSLSDDVLSHALATLSLAEYHAATKDAGIRAAAGKAAAHLVSLRKADGSWGDLVTSAVAQLALESARLGNLHGSGVPYEKAGKVFDARPALKPENLGDVAAYLLVKAMFRGEKDPKAAEFLRKQTLSYNDPDLLVWFVLGAALRSAYGGQAEEWWTWHETTTRSMGKTEDFDLPKLWPEEARPVATALGVLIDLLRKKVR